MPVLFVFLLKVNAALLLFCAGYYFVLRHLTFYTLNRIYLVVAILFASVYPKINISGFLDHHQQIAKPVQAVIFSWQAPAEKLIRPLARPDYWYWAEVVFWAGAALLALRLATQLFSLFKIYRRSKPAQIYNHNVRVIKGDAGPFSFWNSIYVNPDRHEPADLKSILMHEQVHINEWHTLDILLAELSTIFYWFNPGIWLMKKAIRENVEFITDRKILNNGIDTKQYQYSLVNVSFSAAPQGIVNHFNISTIKKRIIMMNTRKSSKLTLTRYAFLVPAVIALLLVFSISKAAFIKHDNHKNIIPAVAKVSNQQMTVNMPGMPANTAPVNAVVMAGLVKKADTIRKGDVFVSTATSADSLTYVINGKKVTKAEFKALDSDQIYAIEIVSGENAAKIMDNINPKHDVMFVTTDDSESGKKFKEKLDNLDGDNMVFNARPMTVYGYSRSGKGSGSGAGSGTITINGAPAMANGSYSMSFNAKPMKLHSFKTMIKGNLTYTTDSVTVNGEPVIVETGADSVQLYEIDGKKSKLKPMVYSYKTRPYINQVWSTNTAPKFNSKGFKVDGWNGETSIDHLSNKVIIIDGKEATEAEMKKLSAADIESLSVKTGEEMTKKYGDKAENGVLFITTKKNKEK